jgi:hypothetical protein
LDRGWCRSCGPPMHILCTAVRISARACLHRQRVKNSAYATEGPLVWHHDTASRPPISPPSTPLTSFRAAKRGRLRRGFDRDLITGQWLKVAAMRGLRGNSARSNPKAGRPRTEIWRRARQDIEFPAQCGAGNRTPVFVGHLTKMTLVLGGSRFPRAAKRLLNLFRC